MSDEDPKPGTSKESTSFMDFDDVEEDDDEHQSNVRKGLKLLKIGFRIYVHIFLLHIKFTLLMTIRIRGNTLSYHISAAAASPVFWRLRRAQRRRPNILDAGGRGRR